MSKPNRPDVKIELWNNEHSGEFTAMFYIGNRSKVGRIDHGKRTKVDFTRTLETSILGIDDMVDAAMTGGITYLMGHKNTILM